MNYASDQQSTAQTDKSLVTAPGTGRRIVVHGVKVSTAVANTVTVESATTLKDAFYMPATATEESPFSAEPIFKCGANEALTYTTTGTGNFFIRVAYRIIPA